MSKFYTERDEIIRAHLAEGMSVTAIAQLLKLDRNIVGTVANRVEGETAAVGRAPLAPIVLTFTRPAPDDISAEELAVLATSLAKLATSLAQKMRAHARRTNPTRSRK